MKYFQSYICDGKTINLFFHKSLNKNESRTAIFRRENRYAREIIEHFPPHFCYLEPCGGSAGVLLNKAPSAVEIYNDLDGEVVNFSGY